jgi:hypothetical protein
MRFRRFGLAFALAGSLLSLSTARGGKRCASPLMDSGSGQVVPLRMNELLQKNLKEACGVDVKCDVV